MPLVRGLAVGEYLGPVSLALEIERQPFQRWPRRPRRMATKGGGLCKWPLTWPPHGGAGGCGSGRRDCHPTSRRPCPGGPRHGAHTMASPRPVPDSPRLGRRRATPELLRKWCPARVAVCPQPLSATTMLERAWRPHRRSGRSGLPWAGGISRRCQADCHRLRQAARRQNTAKCGSPVRAAFDMVPHLHHRERSQRVGHDVIPETSFRRTPRAGARSWTGRLSLSHQQFEGGRAPVDDGEDNAASLPDRVTRSSRACR